MNNILYVNATMREDSRTDELAKYFLRRLDGNIAELKLTRENISFLNEKTLIERTDILNNNDYENDMLKYAKQFAKADIVVFAAPFWDLSFPAILKAYIENITITNVTFKYAEDGNIVGLCNAKEMYYISTSGGKYITSFGYDYVKALCQNMFGIKNTQLIYAENLDIIGNNVNEIIDSAKREIDRIRRVKT